MKKIMAIMLLFTGLCYAERISRTDDYRGYSGDIQLQLDVKLSSHTFDIPFYVGKATMCVHVPEEDRTVFIGNSKSSPCDIYYGFEQNISTMNTTAGKITSQGQATWTLEPGDILKLSNFMGNVYILNEGLILSSSTVIVQRWRSVKEVN